MDDKHLENDVNTAFEYEEHVEEEYIPDDEEMELENSNGGFLSSMEVDTKTFKAPVISFNLSSRNTTSDIPEPKEDIDLSSMDNPMGLMEALSSKYETQSETISYNTEQVDFNQELLSVLNESSNLKKDTSEVNLESENNNTHAEESTSLPSSPEDNNEVIARSILTISDSEVHINEEFKNFSFSKLSSIVEHSLSNSDSAKKEMQDRIEKLKATILEKRETLSSEENQDINLAAPSLVRNHKEKLATRLMKSTSSEKISDYKSMVHDFLKNLASFGAWIKSNTVLVLNKFFKEKSKGYLVGKSEKARPTFSLAHLMGVAAVSATLGFASHNHVNSAVDEVRDYASIQYENIKNIDMKSYVQLASDYAETAMDSLMNVSKRETNANLSNASYNSNVDESSVIMPSSTFIARSYEHLEGVYQNAATSNEIMGSVIKDYINMASICQTNNSPLCKITVHPMGTNIINTGANHQPSSNSIVLDANSGIFEIYDADGNVTYNEESNTNERKLNWF